VSISNNFKKKTFLGEKFKKIPGKIKDFFYIICLAVVPRLLAAWIAGCLECWLPRLLAA